MWMKKRYVLNIAEESHSAVIGRRDADTEIQIDGDPPHPVDFRSVLGGKAISLRRGHRHHLVYLTCLDGKGTLAATLQGRPLRMTVMDELKAQALESLGHGPGSGTITADIPGLVVEIKVQPGQIVHQGQPLIVVEAMKMQNELAAGLGGTVREVPVTVGQTVNPGDVLVVIEPQPGG